MEAVHDTPPIKNGGVQELPKVVRCFLLYFGRAMLISGLHLVSGSCVISSILTLATGALWMVDCEDSEVFDAALKKLHFYGELEGGCGSGITAIMGLSIAGIVFSALDLLAVVIAYSIWWSNIDSYRPLLS